MAKTIEQIQEEVQQIKNETVAKQNTATRVGGALEDMVEKMEADSIEVEGKFNNLGTKVGELPKSADIQEYDLAFSDEDGNVPFAVVDGDIVSQKFNSANTPKLGDIEEFDLAFCDKDGNVPFAVVDGNVRTLKFDSSKIEANAVREIKEARKKAPNVYNGNRIDLTPLSYQFENVMKLNHSTGNAYQGMDIYNGIVCSAHNTGIICLYDLTNKNSTPFATINLASKQTNNHANCVNFGKDKAVGSDFPLLYINVGKVGVSIEYNCYVEKIVKNGDTYSCQLVQTITLDTSGWESAGYTKIFGVPSYMLDKERGHLWVLGAIKRTIYAVTPNPKENKYVLTCFNVPDTSQAIVTLTADDIIKQCVYDFDAYITQGGCARDGKIYYSFGYGYSSTTAAEVEKPCQIRVYDTDTESIYARIDFSSVSSVEPEDLAIYEGKLYMQVNNSTMTLKSFDFSI